MINFLELKRVVEINSYTKNKKGVDANGAIYRQWLEEIGFKTKVHPRGHIGDHLHFVSEKKQGNKILLLGHIDTVFPKDSFEHFSEDEEWVYGAGVCDMKGGNLIAISALREIYKKRSKIENIDMLLVSDEESGSDDSKYLTAALSEDYDYCFVFEAAGKDDEVVVARKGVGTFFIDIEGLASHAGNHYNKGINANLEASYKLQKLTDLTNLELGTTVNVGKIEGGIGANTISPKALLTFEIRYSSEEERERVLSEIDTIVNTEYVKGTKSKLSGGIQRDVMQSSAKQSDLIEKIENIVGYKLKTEARGGVSDANITSSHNVTTIDGFGPYGDGDHTTKERAKKSTFNERIQLVSTILENL